MARRKGNKSVTFIRVLTGLLFAIFAASEFAIAADQENVSGVTVTFDDNESYTFTETDRATIQKIVDATIPEIAAVLPGAPNTVEIVIATGDQVIPELGSTGAALAPGRVTWIVDPTFEGGVAENAANTLRETLFHEIHHLVRGWTFEGSTTGKRMIDAVVAEGLATAFERDAADANPLWGQYDPEVVPAWVEELIPVPDFRDYEIWMFEHPDGRKWIGYRAGTYIADQAIAATGETAATLATMPTDEILEAAGFNTPE